MVSIVCFWDIVLIVGINLFLVCQTRLFELELTGVFIKFINIFFRRIFSDKINVYIFVVSPFLIQIKTLL